jgi:uncharacterized SAM-binding protein YcdF (DUF218 family)
VSLRRRLVASLAILAAIILVVLVSAPIWLPWIARPLQSSGSPRKADIAVVLGGDYHGRRILEAAQLVREGYVPRVLVSGPGAHYGYYECDLAIPFAVRRGFPEQYFVRAPNDARSTQDEANVLIPLLRTMGVKTYVLVTSDYHTRRAGRLFRNAARDLTVYVVASPNAEWQLRRWWEHREGQKAVFTEWVKLVTGYFGI